MQGSLVRCWVTAAMLDDLLTRIAAIPRFSIYAAVMLGDMGRYDLGMMDGEDLFLVSHAIIHF